MVAASERDPVEVLERQGASRIPELLAIRHARMASSPFAFYRGAAAIMAEDLRQLPDSGTTTQLCGDAHLDNVGFYASPERALIGDLNDFDETAPGPFEWDLKRMATSFEIAGRAGALDEDVRHRVLEELVRAYASAMRTASRTPAIELFTGRLDVADLLADLEEELPRKVSRRAASAVAAMLRRDSRSAARQLAVRDDDGLRFRSDPPLLVPVHRMVEQGRITAGDAQERLDEVRRRYRESLAPERRRLLDRYRLADAAVKVVGVGSVGLRAWVLLFEGDVKRDLLVLQAKEAERSVLEPAGRAGAYAHQGERVVRGQRTLQALSDVLLGWTSGADPQGRQREFSVRQFRDWKGGVDVERLGPETMPAYARYCGLVLARAHARGGDPAVLTGYIGAGRTLSAALAAFATAYADRNAADHAALLAAIAAGRVEASAS
ncbi:DUF2252 domain-containing protein [Agromyces agglutinans]|uniref:DUF2252 domain-containing protein n=1 Tax=Agromyces agglutinans TaxID=2662258 RepID=UPI001562489C|nr:DUF2252 domain-containing protein [Agromyces agglutinans]